MPEQDLLGRDWENKFVNNVLGGLRLDLDSENMQSNQFLRLDNLRYHKSILSIDTGYKTFANPIFSEPRRVFQHITANGIANTFLISNASVYKLTGGFWHLVPIGATTVTDATADGTFPLATEIPVADTTGFVLGGIASVELPDGSHHAGLINNVDDGVSIELNPGVAVGITVAVGAVVTPGVQLLPATPTNEFYVDVLSVPWDDRMVFTNGIVPVQYYDPLTGLIQVVPNLPSSGDTVATSLALFDGSVFLIRTVEGGNSFNQRARWCDRGDITNWTTGEAGFVDFFDSSEKLQKAMKIGPYLSIYREKSIIRGSAVNSALQRFDWGSGPVVSDQGLIAPGAVTAVGKNTHLAVGDTKIYLYNGGFTIQDIGESVSSLFYGVEAELDRALAHKIFNVYIDSRDEVLIFYPSVDSTHAPDKCLRWDNKKQVFAGRREFADELIGFGSAIESNVVTWSTAVGTWAEQTQKWNSSSVVSDLLTILLCRSTGPDTAIGQVLEYDYFTAGDNGIAFDAVIETPDFMHQNGELRHDYLELRCGGAEFTVEYSTDRGNNWMLLGMADPGIDLAKVRLYKQFVARAFRYRITASSGFKLSWFNVRVSLETEN